MPISNYPNGFKNGINLRGVNVLNTHAGSVFWVDSATGSDGYKGTFERPFATLDYAIGRCTANKGDIIMIKPNHAETITGVGGITNDVAGVSVVGLGVGEQKPRFLMDGADTVTWLVSAADVTIQNVVLAAGHADVVLGVNVTGKGCHLIDVDFVENTTAENFLTPIKATGADNTADGLTIVGCRNHTLDAAALEFLEITGNLDFLVIRGCEHYATGGTASPLILQAGSKIIRYADIGWNRVQHAMTAGDLLIDNGGATNSGLVYNNYCGNLDVTGGQVGGAATGIQFFENLFTSTSVASGALEPVADTPLT